MSRVAYASPPITTIAIGCTMSVPSPIASAIVVKPSIVVIAVIMMVFSVALGIYAVLEMGKNLKKK